MPDNFPNKIFLFPLVAVATVFFGLFVYAKIGPALPLSVSQITTTKNSLFSVTGEGKVTAIPNTAEISLGFTASAQTVSDVQTQANTIIKKISADVKNLGVEDKDIQTTSYNLRPDYDYSGGTSQRIKGYVIDANLSVKARQFDKINKIIDTATADGANQVGGLSFTLDDATQQKLTSDARKMAIDQAKAKAAEIANESGINLGKIVDVQENQPNFVRPMPMVAGLGAADSKSAQTQIEPGSSDITITVTVSYETR